MIPVLHLFKSKKWLFIGIKRALLGFPSDQPPELNLPEWFINFLLDFFIRPPQLLTFGTVHRVSDPQFLFLQNVLKVKRLPRLIHAKSRNLGCAVHGRVVRECARLWVRFMQSQISLWCFCCFRSLWFIFRHWYFLLMNWFDLQFLLRFHMIGQLSDCIISFSLSMCLWIKVLHRALERNSCVIFI